MNTPRDLERDVQDMLAAAVRDTPFDGQAVDRLLGARHARGRTSPPRRRPRWIAPLLAAAAVVAVAGGITTTAILADHNQPAVQHSPTPNGTYSAPTPSPTAPSTRARKTPVHTSNTTIHIKVGPRGPVVRLTVPTSWHLSRTQPQACCDTPQTVCLVSGRSDWGNDPEHCVLTITAGYSAGGGLSPDAPFPSVGPPCSTWKTTQDSDASIQGRSGAYRAFLDGCTNVASEMWTIMSAPQLAFWHPITASSTHAVAAGIVTSATLPPVSDTRRQLDHGYLTSLTRSGTTYRVAIDRVVPSLDGTIINHDAATYAYPIRGTEAFGNQVPCGGPSSCDLAHVLTQFRKGPHPADGTAPASGAYVEVTTYGAGTGYDLFFGPPASSAAPAATTTSVLYPVDQLGRPVAGYAVTGEPSRQLDCKSASASRAAVSNDILYCSPDAEAAVACWKAADPAYALCLRDPWTKQLVRIADGAVFPTAAAPHDPVPLGLELDDGTRCVIRDGGALSALAHHPDWTVYYTCAGQTAVWALAKPSGSGIDRASSTWTVTVGSISGTGAVTTHRVRAAYLVGTARR